MPTAKDENLQNEPIRVEPERRITTMALKRNTKTGGLDNAAAAALAATLLALTSSAAGLEGWWRFAETGGDESVDSSWHGRAALVDTNRVWRVAAAPGGGALWFDGDADAWNDGFALYVRDGGALGAYVRSGADANAAAGGSLATNAWSHVAMTYSGTELRLYLNGREVASRSFADGASADAPAPLAVGTLVGADGVRPFSGAIADVRVWSSELSAAEVADVCRQFVGETLAPDGDADGDGMPNGWEILHALDPHDASDACMDSDGDGMSNLEEFVLGRNPCVGARPATLIYSASASPL